MLLSEAKQILKQNGYLIEETDYDLNREGHRGSIQAVINGTVFTSKDFKKNSNWLKLQNEIKSFKYYYPKWLELSEMNSEELSKHMKEFYNLSNALYDNQKRISWCLKDESLKVDLGENAKEIYNEKSKEVEEYNKKTIADKTNAVIFGDKDDELSWPGFEKAIVLNVDWINATFYKWSGYCIYISLSDIPGLTQGENCSRGRYDLTPANINKIEKWLNDNKDLVNKEMKKGKAYFDSIDADQASYYKAHPRGNWSGD